MTKHILYINASYHNEATLDGTMDEEIASLGNVTWKTLLTEIKAESLDWLLQDENLQSHYGIEPHELEETIGPNEVERYYDDLSFHLGNSAGNEAYAFNFIRSLALFPMDIDGNGGVNGVWLEQTTADGPRKIVQIEDASAAEWLQQQFSERGLNVEIKFI